MNYTHRVILHLSRQIVHVLCACERIRVIADTTLIPSLSRVRPPSTKRGQHCLPVFAMSAINAAYAGIEVTPGKGHTIAGENKVATPRGLCADERIAMRQRSVLSTNSGSRPRKRFPDAASRGGRPSCCRTTLALRPLGNRALVHGHVVGAHALHVEAFKIDPGTRRIFFAHG